MHALLKRRLVWSLVLVGAVASIGVLLLSSRHARITQASCDRIEVGMSEQEVWAILGGAPGNYQGWPTRHEQENYRRPWPDSNTYTDFWIGEEGVALITYSA